MTIDWSFWSGPATDEEKVRQRAYAIWLAEGCPEGKAVEHWLRAKAELDAGAEAGYFLRGGLRVSGKVEPLVMPRPPISAPPQTVTAGRISRKVAGGGVSVARR